MYTCVVYNSDDGRWSPSRPSVSHEISRSSLDLDNNREINPYLHRHGIWLCLQALGGVDIDLIHAVALMVPSIMSVYRPNDMLFWAKPKDGVNKDFSATIRTVTVGIASAFHKYGSIVSNFSSFEKKTECNVHVGRPLLLYSTSCVPCEQRSSKRNFESKVNRPNEWN
jgi:hypothetical protein